MRLAAALLDAGAPRDAVDRGGDTPLHWAAHNARWAACALLIERGAALMVRNADGGCAVHAACINDAPRCLQLLLDAGADANARFGAAAGHDAATASLDTPAHW